MAMRTPSKIRRSPADENMSVDTVERRVMSKENIHTAEQDPADFVKFAKNRAKRLRKYLTEKGYPLSHSESLEAIAQAEGYRDWNTYSALFKLVSQELTEPSDKSQHYPLHVGDRIQGTYRGVRFSGTLLGLEETITSGVWRAKLNFDNPVQLPSHEALNHTRQRVRCMLNIDGNSVNLKGTPDGHITLDMP